MTPARAVPALRLARVLGWRRLRLTLFFAVPFGLMMSIDSATSVVVWLLRMSTVGVGALLAYGIFEQWPARLPDTLARWVAQLLAVVVAVPFSALLAYWATTGGEPKFAQEPLRWQGFLILSFAGVLFAPWLALGAMVRQREALAREQALGFQLERSELERQALDARLRLMQAQVQPHFLFNTLANVSALVNAGSPQASRVLDSLIAYLRAAVPRLGETSTTFDHELQLVRAYLELMQMRMPDRLQFSLHADDAALSLHCPPMTLLTLVENAVRHGIDPSEQGGRIDVDIELRDGRCRARVVDTGVGLDGAGAAPQGGAGSSLGTGLSTLRERLSVAFAGAAQLRLAAVAPHGMRAEVEFPAEATGALKAAP